MQINRLHSQISDNEATIKLVSLTVLRLMWIYMYMYIDYRMFWVYAYTTEC